MADLDDELAAFAAELGDEGLADNLSDIALAASVASEPVAAPHAAAFARPVAVISAEPSRTFEVPRNTSVTSANVYINRSCSFFLIQQPNSNVLHMFTLFLINCSSRFFFIFQQPNSNVPAPVVCHT